MYSFIFILCSRCRSPHTRLLHFSSSAEGVIGVHGPALEITRPTRRPRAWPGLALCEHKLNISRVRVRRPAPPPWRAPIVQGFLQPSQSARKHSVSACSGSNIRAYIRCRLRPSGKVIFFSSAAGPRSWLLARMGGGMPQGRQAAEGRVHRFGLGRTAVLGFDLSF